LENLRQETSSEIKDIKIYAEDMDYTGHDRLWRASRILNGVECPVRLPMTMVKDLEALLSVDEHNFVFYNRNPRDFYYDRKAPVFDILAESIEPSKWPAAILGPAVYKNIDEIYDVRDDSLHHKMLATPRVVEMLECYTCFGFDEVLVEKRFVDELDAPLLWAMKLYVKK
jgi:hypothetical protein